MRKREVCQCGKWINNARQALDLDTCEECAKNTPGNILRNEDRGVKIREATLDAITPRTTNNAALQDQDA